MPTYTPGRSGSRNRPRALAVACLFLLALVAAPACAADLQAEAAALLRQGQKHLAEGRSAEAYGLFRRAFELEPGDAEINFLLGRAAMERGDCETALMAFDRALIAEPGAPRIRLEAARCLFQLGSYEESRDTFRQVLAGDPPAAVRSNIETYLAAIEAALSRHRLDGVLSLGLSHDDNVRAAPADERVRTALGDVILSGPEAESQSDLFASAALSLHHAFHAEDGPLGWRSSAVSYNAFYRQEDDLDLNFLALSSGPALRAGRALCRLYGLASYLEFDYRRYLASYGIGASLDWTAGEGTAFSLSGQFEEKTFFAQPGKDAGNLRFDAGPTFRWRANALDLRLGVEAENAEDDVNSYNRLELGLRYQRTLPRDFSAFVSYRHLRSDYDERLTLFEQTRRDRVQHASLGVARVLWHSPDQRRSLSAQLSHTFTDADSSVPLYEYDKNTTAFLLAYGF